ncbi:hypothetical protein BGU52_19890, partial [Clostridioides difficile]
IYLIEHLDNIPDPTTIVFVVYGDVDIRKSLVKKDGHNGIVFDCDKLSDIALYKWIKTSFALHAVILAVSYTHL